MSKVGGEEKSKETGMGDSGSDDSLASTASNVFGGTQHDGEKKEISGDEKDVVSDSDDDKDEEEENDNDATTKNVSPDEVK